MSSWGLRRSALIIGDIVCLLAALPLTLTIRTGHIPTEDALMLHALPFGILAVISIVVFFSAGLYDRATALISRELPGTIFGAEVVNIGLAVLLFFFIPFGIAPKTNLAVYLMVSVALVSIWRVAVPRVAQGFVPRTAVVIGEGPDIVELLETCRGKNLCPLEVIGTLPVSAPITELSALLERTPDFVVADSDDPRLATLLPTILAYTAPRRAFLDFTNLYELVFRKVPLSTLSYRWFITHATSQHAVSDILKRFADIISALILLFFLALITPLVWMALRIEGKGPLFITQERLGRDGAKMRVIKFRTMTKSLNEDGVWVGETTNRVTRVGAYLRQASIDELPQVLSILEGSLSFIGPRSDIAGLAERLASAIPFYMVRYSVTPGISGWAQVNQRYSPGNISPQSIEESRVRLAYDLYYVKHRSPFLDASIALRTIKTLILRVIPHG